MRLAGRCGLRRDRRGLAEERWGVTGWELRDGTEKQGRGCDVGRGATRRQGAVDRGAAQRRGYCNLYYPVL